MESRLWRLYDLIKDRSLKGQYLTIKDICMLLPKDYELDTRVNTHCENTQIYRDINTINNSKDVEKIILTDNNHIHLATDKTECSNYIKKMERHLWNEYNKYLDIKRKMGVEGQLKLIDLKGNVIDEDSKARREVEPYLNKEEPKNESGAFMFEGERFDYKDEYELQVLKELFNLDDEYIETHKVEKKNV